MDSGSTTFDTGALGLMKAGSTAFIRTPDGTAIGSKTGTAASSYYITDHLGSVIGLFNASGCYLGGYSYSPYGETRTASTNAVVAGNILRYTGGELDSSGLYKLGARYYDPSLGRFTQADPSGQEQNVYSYNSCNPANGADPSGLVSTKFKRNFACILDVVQVVGAVSAAAGAIGALTGATGGIGLALGSWYAGTFIYSAYDAVNDFGDAMSSCRKFRW